MQGAALPLFFRELFAAKRPEPSYPPRPLVGDDGRSSVPGVYLAGEIAGTPLVKLGLNQGVAIADAIHAELTGMKRTGELLDLVVVGAGASGLAAAMRARELGLSCVVVEAERMAQTIVGMYRGKVLFAEPAGVENRSSLWFEECTREQLLERWRAQVEAAGLDVREHERVVDIRRAGGGLVVETNRAKHAARRVLLAIGKAGNPRKAGVPGEDAHAERVLHGFSDPSDYEGKRVFIYGGGDVACEAALALAPHNDVTLVTVDEDLIYPKKRNADAVREAAARGGLKLSLKSRLLSIDDGAVTFADGSGAKQTVANDVVFEMIGAELPLGLLKRVGLSLEGEWHWRRWVSLALVSLLVYSLYALKKFPELPYSWPFPLLVDHDAFARVVAGAFDVGFAPFRLLFTDAAYGEMRGTLWFQQGYLYSLAYTVVMIVFGALALLRWGRVARDARYQRWRYLSLIAFQLGFFLAANVVAVQGLSLQHAWRAWGLYQPWPLFFQTFHWWSSSDPRAVVAVFVGAGLLGTLVVIPLLARRHGKRFCTWVCGCGGLAETLGDRWRHLAPKGKRSRAWEFQGAVVLVAALVVTLVTVGAFGTRADNPWALAYSYVVDFWLVAVIPVALYPFFGGKVWCRYWCPLAAWNQILARWYGRLRITSNDKCISCTQCSRHCQVGVDVMAFAKNQLPLDNKSSSCIQCGVCIDVCPMGVLSFDVGETKGRARRLPVLR